MNLGRAENYQSETLSGIYSAPGNLLEVLGSEG
jgi:hypothetical protein